MSQEPDSRQSPPPQPPKIRPPRILPPVGCLLALGLIWGLHRLLPYGPTFLDHPAAETITRGLAVLGLALTISGIGLFHRAGTGIKPFSEARHLVTGGPYRLTRNPMYLGMVLILLGAFVKSGTLAGLLVPIAFALWIDRAYIRREEAFLEQHLGAPYLAYKDRVRRWL
ncbi:methyltransferase family protein [Yunchengibacter salinarum]|uniref:methyltransferase family protein n=1 Tax=Yunchengibacter salinarum TaxID=3133399 RepID=UPI0035B63FBD